MTSSSKKKLLIILSRVPSKLDKGDKLRAFHQLRYLSKEFDIVLICLDTEVSDHDLSSLEVFCLEVKVFRITKISRLINLFLAFFSGKPYQVGYFYNSKVQREVNKVVKSFGPDHIYAQLIRTAEYVKNIHHIPKTLDYMDAFSKGIERRAKLVNPLIKPLFKAENRRLLKYESLIFEYFENKTIISEVDREYIFHVERNKIRVVSNGIDESFFDTASKWNNSDQILFTGNLSYPPNIKAAEFIGRELAPEMKEMNFIIAGANSDKIPLKSDNVKQTGWVEDLREEYKRAKVFIAPMFIGTGVQNKLLEAMAMGLPCVTTNLGNKPLGAKEGDAILIANTKEEFSSQIECLLSDKKKYDQIAENGRLFVQQHFSWEESTRELIDIMNK